MIVPIDFIWIVVLSVGWLFCLIMFTFMAFMLKLTPALTFLKAWAGQKGVILIKNKAGVGEFIAGKIKHGLISCKDKGTFILTENSKIIDKKSKATIFTAFSEFAATIPSDYEETINTLRSKGYRITDFRDYKHLVLLTNKEYATKYVDTFKNEIDKKKARDLIEKVNKEKLEFMPYKTMGLNELGHMFPFNLSPVYLDAISQEEINQRMRSMDFNKKMIIWVAIGILVIFIGGALAWKMIKSGNPEITLNLKDIGIQTIKNVSNSVTL